MGGLGGGHGGVGEELVCFLYVARLDLDIPLEGDVLHRCEFPDPGVPHRQLSGLEERLIVLASHLSISWLHLSVLPEQPVGRGYAGRVIEGDALLVRAEELSTALRQDLVELEELNRLKVAPNPLAR